MPKCTCGRESTEEYPSGWYALLGNDEFHRQFCSYECLTKFGIEHRYEMPLDTQWVRWK